MTYVNKYLLLAEKGMTIPKYYHDTIVSAVTEANRLAQTDHLPF